MIEIQLQTPEEFWDLNLPSNEEILSQLQETYPQEIEYAIEFITELHAEIGTKTDNIFDLVSIAQLIEEVDSFLEDEILINYYVVDSFGSDKGTGYITLENGYKILEEPLCQDQN